jgi:transposase
MRAYPQELRYRVLRAVDEGTAREEIIARFHVSRSTIKGYLKQRREIGHVLPLPIPGRPPKKKAALLLGVPALLEAHPEASQREDCQWWKAEHGVQVSSASMGRAIHALGWMRYPKKYSRENVQYRKSCWPWARASTNLCNGPGGGCSDHALQ